MLFQVNFITVDTKALNLELNESDRTIRVRQAKNDLFHSSSRLFKDKFSTRFRGHVMVYIGEHERCYR